MPLSPETSQLINSPQFYSQPESEQIDQLSRLSSDFNSMAYEDKKRTLSAMGEKFKAKKSNVPGTPWYRKPTVPLDKLIAPPNPSQSGPEQVVRGAAQGAAQGVSQFSTPENAGLIGGMALGGKVPVVGPAIRAGAAAYFTYEQAKQLIESIPELKKAWNEGNVGEIGRVLGNDAVAALAGYKSGKGLAEGVRGKISRPVPDKTAAHVPDPYAEMGRAAKEPEKPWWQGIYDKSLEEVRQIVGQRGSGKAATAPPVDPGLPGHVKAWAGEREGLGARTAAPEGYVFPKPLPGKDTVAAARGEESTAPGKPIPDPSQPYRDIARVASEAETRRGQVEAYPKPPATGPGKSPKPPETKAAPEAPKSAAKPKAEPVAAKKSLANEDAAGLNKRREEFVKLQKELRDIPEGPQKTDMLAKVSRAIESIDAALKGKGGESKWRGKINPYKKDGMKTDVRQTKPKPSDTSRQPATPGGSKGKIAAGEPAPKSAPTGAAKTAAPPEPPSSQEAPKDKASAGEPATPVREAVQSILDQVQRAKIDRFSIRVRNAEGEEIYSGEYEGDASPDYVESAFKYLRGAHKIEIIPLGPNRGIKSWVKFLAPETVKAPPG